MQKLKTLTWDPVTASRLLRRESIERILRLVQIGLFIIILGIVFWLLREAIGSFFSMGTDLQVLENLSDAPTDPTDGTKRGAKTDYTAITAAGVFGPIGVKTDVSATQAKPVSNLALNLVGTFMTDKEAPYAIIEDDKKKVQDVFVIGETIFGEAKLVTILSDRVEINRNGTIEVLKLDDAPDSAGGTPKAGITDVGNDEFMVEEAELNQALENLPLLLTQARAVPYFKDGRSIGLRLFAIRTGSLFEKIGLKNGDILKSVNGQSLADMTQAMKLFEKLKEERSVNVTLERDRTDREFKYQIR